MFLKDEMSQTARNAHSDEAHAGAGDASFSFRFYAQKLAKSYILILFSNQNCAVHPNSSRNASSTFLTP